MFKSEFGKGEKEQLTVVEVRDTKVPVDTDEKRKSREVSKMKMDTKIPGYMQNCGPDEKMYVGHFLEVEFEPISS